MSPTHRRWISLPNLPCTQPRFRCGLACARLWLCACLEPESLLAAAVVAIDVTAARCQATLARQLFKTVGCASRRRTSGTSSSTSTAHRVDTHENIAGRAKVGDNLVPCLAHTFFSETETIQYKCLNISVNSSNMCENSLMLGRCCCVSEQGSCLATGPLHRPLHR